PGNDPPFRPKFAYLNARTLLRFGHVREAEERLRQVMQSYCADATVAGAAFADLFNLLLLQGRDNDREQLARAQATSACAGVNRETITVELTNSQFRHAM